MGGDMEKEETEDVKLEDKRERHWGVFLNTTREG